MIVSAKNSRYNVLLPYSWVSWVFLASFVLQIGQNITSEIAGSSSLVDRAGFALMLLSGFVLFLRALAIKSVFLLPLFLALGFAIYNGIGIALTGDGLIASLSTIFIPRYGYFLWMLIGLLAHLAVSEIERRSAKTAYSAHILFPGLAIFILVFVLRDYIVDPLSSDSYQFAAMNAAILLLVSTLALDRWRSNLAKTSPLLASGIMLYLLSGSVLAYSVALMGATSIVLIWIALLVLWMIFVTKMLGAGSRLMLFGIIFIAAYWFYKSLLDDFLLLTRFQAIETEGLFISSVTSRLDLLPTFSSQFSVNPIFGHSYAEMLSGYDRGEYVHSVPLSLLTHAGIIGFCLFLLLIGTLLSKQLRSSNLEGNNSARSNRIKIVVFMMILLVGSAVAFFSWLPLWFLIGYLMVSGGSRSSLVDMPVSN